MITCSRRTERSVSIMSTRTFPVSEITPSLRVKRSARSFSSYSFYHAVGSIVHHSKFWLPMSALCQKRTLLMAPAGTPGYLAITDSQQTAQLSSGYCASWWRCPLWVRNGHPSESTDVRFTPEGGLKCAEDQRNCVLWPLPYKLKDPM